MKKNVIISADPYVMFDEKRQCYYCYSTNDSENKAFSIHKSTNLQDWVFVNYALDLTHPNIWGKDWFWAPECYYNSNNNHYYLFYSARVKNELTTKYFFEEDYEESCKIGIAVSKSPEGPFVNLTSEPLDFSPFDFDYLHINDIADNVFELEDNLLLAKASQGSYIPAIDANLFIDHNRMVLYFSRCCYRNCRYDDEFKRFIEASNVACVELDTAWWFDKEAKMMPTIKKEYITYDEKGRRRDKFITLISYQTEAQAWENAHVDDYNIYQKKRKNRRWSEGGTTFPLVIDGKIKYGMTYSCNCYEDSDYAVGIAFADNPMGPFKKYELNPIIKAIDGGVCSTGHGSLVYHNEEWYYFLHARLDVGQPRILCYTKLFFQNSQILSDEIVVCNSIDK